MKTIAIPAINANLPVEILVEWFIILLNFRSYKCIFLIQDHKKYFQLPGVSELERVCGPDVLLPNVLICDS